MPRLAILLRATTVLPGVLCCAGVLGAAGASAQVVDLRPGEPRWIEATAGATTELAFDVEADQFVHLEVRQDGADVAAVVLDPAGAVVREVDDAPVGKIIEPISWTQSRPGRHALRVQVTGWASAHPVRGARIRPHPHKDCEFTPPAPRRAHPIYTTLRS